MINLYNVTKHTKTNTQNAIIQNITLTIQKGEFVAITGRVGSGKTTLLDILAMLQRPSYGKYMFDGIDIVLLKEHELEAFRSSQMGFVFQKPNFIPGLNVYKNLECALLYREDINDTKQKIQEALEEMTLKDPGVQELDFFSRLDQQKFALARAYLCSEQLILADEPTGDLSRIETEEFFAELQTVNAKGTTVIFTTSDVDIARHAKRVIVLNNGRVEKDIQLSNSIIARDMLEKLKLKAQNREK